MHECNLPKLSFCRTFEIVDELLLKVLLRIFGVFGMRQSRKVLILFQISELFILLGIFTELSHSEFSTKHADKNTDGVSGGNAYLHWLCVNIEGPEVLQGLDVAHFHPLKPAKYSGKHRFLWLVYEQPEGRQYFEFSPIKDSLDSPSPRRANFSVAEFALRNKLGPVLAANVFLSVLEPDQMYKQGSVIG